METYAECYNEGKMAKRKSEGGNRRTRGVSITAYVPLNVKRELLKLVNLVADELDRERMLQIGVMLAYAAEHLLTVPTEEAIQILKAGKAYDEAHDPSLSVDPLPQVKKPEPGSGDKASPPKLGAKKTIPKRITGRPKRGAVAHDPSLEFTPIPGNLVGNNLPVGQVGDPR